MIKTSRSRRRLSRLAAVAIPAEPPPTITISGDSRLACADVLDMFRSLSLPRALLMSADALHADRKFRLIAGGWAGIDAQRAIRRTPADERGEQWDDQAKPLRIACDEHRH